MTGTSGDSRGHEMSSGPPLKSKSMTGIPLAKGGNAIYMTTFGSIIKEQEPFPDIFEHKCRSFFKIQIQLAAARKGSSEASVSHSVYNGLVPTLPNTWHLSHTVSKRVVCVLLE